MICAIAGLVWFFARCLRELQDKFSVELQSVRADVGTRSDSLRRSLDEQKEGLRLFAEKVVESEASTRRHDFTNLDQRTAALANDIRIIERTAATRDDVRELSSKIESIAQQLSKVPVLGEKLDNLMGALERLESRLDHVERGRAA